MTREADDPDVRTLARRLDRERRARLEAERIAEDTTRELYERQETLRELAEIVETAGDAIYALTPKSRIRSWNRSAAALYGYSAEDAIGQPFATLVPPNRSEEIDEILGKVFSGEKVEGQESEARRQDGALVEVSLTVSPIKDAAGVIVGASVIARDISERNRAQAEADRLKDGFIGLVSHDLRTPLTSVKGFAKLLLEGQGGELTEQGVRFLEVIGRNISRLERLVDDLLFAAQIEAGTFALKLATVDLRELLTQSVEAARPRAEEKHIEIALEATPVPGCQGDADRIAQLLDNLLSNAIKYSSEGGRVQTRLSGENGHALVEIEDSGVGIGKAEQEFLFDRFFRASGANTASREGVGLGLTIVKAIATAHGGQVTVASEEGAGTTFRVQLPLDPAQPPPG